MWRDEVEADAADDGSAVFGVRVGRTDVDDVEAVAIDLEVRRHDRGTVGRKCRDELALREAHSLDRLDELEVHGTDVRDDADLRARDRGQVRDLAEAAHRELEDADLRVGLEPAERQRNADLVVEARLRRDRARGGCAERRENVLRRRLAHRAGDADHTCIAAVAHRRRDPRQRRERIVGNESRRGAALERLVDELRAAADRDEQVAGDDSPGIDLDAGELVLARAPLSEPGENRDWQSDHAGVFRFRSAARATSRSSNGMVRSANSWPCSCPLPAITTTSPAAADSIARSIAARRSSSTSTSRPSATSAAMAAGSSLRGLSDVTIATSASSAATRPISGRFSR